MLPSQPKIAVLSVHSSPLGKPGARDTGGMSIYIREGACELAKLGLTVDIYTRMRSRTDKEIIELMPGTRLIHLRAGAIKEIDKLLIYSYLPDFACHVESFRRRNNLHYDLIFSNYWLSGVVGQSLQRWWQVPHIMMFHTLGAVKNALGIGEDEPELRIETEGELARSCQCLIAASENEKTNLIQHYNALSERIRVVPCGVNLGLFQPADKNTAKRRLGFDDDKLILFVGRIEPLKGIDNLLRSMPYLRNGSTPRLVIVGGDGHSQTEVRRLKRLASELEIADSVTFSGLIDYEEMPGFYNAADVCVIPSFYESFGLVAIESLACGTPIVATNVGDIKNIVVNGETGYVVEDNTPINLARSISSILSNPALDTQRTQFIRSSVARFNWSNIAGSLADLFKEELAKNFHFREL